jgi:hypothetical protein
MQITMQGKYQTRDGRAVRIVSVDRQGGGYCVVGLVQNGLCGDEDVEVWKIDGTREVHGCCDLVPVRTKHEGWIVVNDNGSQVIEPAIIFSSEQLLHRMFGACVTVAHVTWEV